MRQSTIVIGRRIEEKAKDILKQNSFLVSDEKVRRISPYDIIAEKDNKKFYIEVKGRTTEKENRIFCINEIKIEKLMSCDGEVLFIFINNEGYVICPLIDIINRVPININDKKIFISFNRSFRRREKK